LKTDSVLGFVVPNELAPSFEVLSRLGHIKIQTNTFIGGSRSKNIQGHTTVTYIMKDSAGARAIDGHIQPRRNDVANVPTLCHMLNFRLFRCLVKSAGQSRLLQPK
jgi:hypothetical protein